MTTYFTPSNIPWQFSADGEPAASYVLHAFDSGASTTARTMYSDNSGTSAGTSITLDSEGYISTSDTRHPVWLDSARNYRLELRDNTDVTVVWQADNVSVFGSSTSIVYDSFNDAKAANNSGFNVVTTRSYAGSWSGTATGPEGGATYHRDGTTGTASTAYSSGAGFFDANGDGFSVQNSTSVHAAWFGVNGTTDSASALVSAVAHADGRAVILPRTVKLDTTASITADKVKLVGSGDGTHIDCSGGGALEILNTVTSLPNLSANIDAGENLITFASAHGLSEGDLIAAYNPTSFSFSPYRDYYRDGCMFRLSDVPTTTTAKTYGLSPSTFASGDMTMHQLNGQGVHLESFRLTPKSTGLSIWISAHQRVKLHDIKVEKGSDDAAIEIWRCYDIDIENVNSTALLGGSYPISIANSQKITVTRSQLYTNRHCFSTGGRSGDASVPSRDYLINSCHLVNNCDLGVGASDVHGNVENIRYSDCHINAHANIAGKNVTYTNCRILGRPASYSTGDGSVAFGSEPVGGNLIFDNCEFETYGDFNSTAGIDIDISEITEDMKLIIRNSRILNKHSNPSSAKVIRLIVGDSSPPTSQVDIVIDGLEYDAAVKPLALLSLSGANDISSTLTIDIDNLFAPDTTVLVSATNATNLTANMRMMKQEIETSLTTAIGSSEIVSSTIGYRYKFPKKPNFLAVSAGSSDGTAQSADRGGKVIVPWIYFYDSQDVRVSINSGDGANWTSAEAVKLWVEAAIRDF